jgi:hypothetical protein
MKRKHIIVLLVLSLAVLCLGVAVWTYPKFKKIEKRGPAPASVAAVVPGDVNSVAALIAATFNDWSEFDRPDLSSTYRNKFPDASPWSHFFLFRRDGKPGSVFPTDDEIRLDKGNDSFVEHYVQIPFDLRARDFYLYEPTGDYYWNSEYFYKGQPAEFHCSFLIHLEAADSDDTKVEIFEYQPTIRVGKYVGMSAHSIFPAALYDIRPVEATTRDREALLAVIQKAESQDDAHSKTGTASSVPIN